MASDEKVSFSSKVEYRAVIRYLYLKGKTGQEIHCELTNVYGSSAPSYAQGREKGRGKLSKGILLQQDNARVHTCKIAMDAVERSGYELIPHLPILRT